MNTEMQMGRRKRGMQMLGGGSDAVPMTIAGLQLWLAADRGAYKDGGSTLAADNETVQQWNDQSGNGNHATQSNASKRFTLVRDSSGRWVMRSNGTNQFFSLPSGSGSNLNLTGDYTIYAVIATTSTNEALVHFGDSVNANAGYLMGVGQSTFSAGAQTFLSSGVVAWRGGTHKVNGGAFQLISQTLNGTAFKCWRNGWADSSGVSAAPVTWNGARAIGSFHDGSSNFFNGDIAEVLVYSGSHSDATRQLIETYFNAKYALWNYQWTRQGVVLTQSVPADENNVFESNVIYESGAQILSGTVYKLWYTAGWASPNICYAESADGLTFTKYPSNPVVTVHARSRVVKFGSTYYMYCAAGASGLQIDLYTSSDGITWTLDTSSTIPRGGAGQWDDAHVYSCDVWQESPTDWRMMYEADGTGGAGIGYATSSDGRTWSKSGSNPVVSSGGGELGRPKVHKIGSVYWMWCHGVLLGSLPTDLYRYSSSDLITWTPHPVGPILSRATADEGTFSNNGQAADPYILEVGGQVYLYYSGSADGSAQAGKQQIKRVLYNGTLAQLVTTNEDF